MTGLSYGHRRLVQKIVETHWEISNPESRLYKYNDMLFILQELMEQEGKPYFEERLSMRGYNIFKHFVQHLLYRNLANYDSMILITAEKGVGKSSAAIMMARFWCSLLGKVFNPARHIAYNNADVMHKIDLLDKFEPIIADESIRFACVVGETLIKTPQGEIPIKQLEGKKDFEVFSYNEETKQEEIQVAEKCIKVKEDVVYEIETESGEKIQATKEHKFLTPSGWKMLGELEEGDDIIGV